MNMHDLPEIATARKNKDIGGLIKIIKYGDWQASNKALAVLLKLCEEEKTAKPLLEVLIGWKNKSWGLEIYLLNSKSINEIFKLIGELKDEAALSLLVELLKDKDYIKNGIKLADPKIAMNAIFSFGARGIMAMKDALAHIEEDVKLNFVKKLSSHITAEVLDALIPEVIISNDVKFKYIMAREFNKYDAVWRKRKIVLDTVQGLIDTLSRLNPSQIEGDDKTYWRLVSYLKFATKKNFEHDYNKWNEWLKKTIEQ